MYLKKYTAFVLSLLMLTLPFNGVLAKETHYYSDFEPSYTDFSDMKYEKYDISTFNERLDRVKTLLKSPGTSKEIFDIMEECSAEFDEVQTLYALAVINASRENTPENNLTVNEAYTVYMDMLRGYNAAAMGIYNSRYKKDFIEWYGEAETEEFIKNYPSAKFYELSEAEQKLINEYMNNQFGSAKIKYNDTEYGFDDIINILDESARMLEMSDIEMAKEGHIRSDIDKGIGLYRQYLKESNTVLGVIYQKLIDVRSEIAKECGYDNYAEYAYSEVYARDYTIDEVNQFREYVKEHIVPLYIPLSEMLYDLQRSDTEYSEAEILEMVGKYADDISSEMREAFDYMLKYHLIDMSESDKKEAQGTAYTVALPKYRSAYLFESPLNDSVWQITTTVHEFGHFNAMLHEPAYSQDTQDRGQNLDVSEIHSQGLELLFMKYYDSIFGNSSSYEKIVRICDMLSSIIDGCLYDEWQYEVYKNPGMTLDEINNLFKDISMKYGNASLSDESISYAWITVNHNFAEPMYYISYAVSAAAAMRIWERSLYDFDGAADQYMSLTAKGSYVSFKETLDECGFDDVFSEDALKNISDGVKKAFCLDYDDITASAWYYTAVAAVSEYFGAADNSFKPEENASRCTAAEVIGRIYDKEKGIEGETAPVFYDASSKYISWAAAHDIVNGYNGEYFGADDALTREQAAAIIYRYAAYNGLDTAVTKDFDGFSDAYEVSDWARDAVLWTVSNGIINGRDNGTLAPHSNVTRAELAQMISNLMQNVLTN